MARSTPAAGASGGALPLPAALHLPDFMRLEGAELVTLLHVLRDPLAVHLYLLLLVQMDYTQGAFLASYARLIALMRRPSPERGRKPKDISMKRMRNALQALIDVDLVRRGRDNEAQGQLRLWLAPRIKKTKKPAS